MRIFPYYHETLVLPLASENVIQILLEQTFVKGVSLSANQKFTGIINSDSFRISEKISRPDNFIPLIKGKIEKTSKGSIIFTSYNLLFSTALFLSFWSIITLMLTLIFLFQFDQPIYSGISFAAFVFNYLFTAANFHRKVKSARQTFYSLFTDD